MGRTKSVSNKKLLTEVELELMSILWTLGEGSVADVMERLSPRRTLAYTSVSTMLRILEQKDVLTTRKEGRGHIYIPKLARDEYESTSVSHLVEKVFGGETLPVVRQLLSSQDLSAEELKEIRKLIESQLT